MGHLHHETPAEARPDSAEVSVMEFCNRNLISIWTVTNSLFFRYSPHDSYIFKEPKKSARLACLLSNKPSIVCATWTEMICQLHLNVNLGIGELHRLYLAVELHNFLVLCMLSIWNYHPDAKLCS